VSAPPQPQYWWFFLVEYGRKAYINFLYTRGFRADDGFSWKLAVAIYLLLEGAAVARLKPRVFKKSSDMLVDTQSKMLLATVLVLGIYSDQQSNVLSEGTARPSDDYFCGNFNPLESETAATDGQMACDDVLQCVWDSTAADPQCIARDVSASASIFLHLFYGLPGLAPLLLNKIFALLDRKPRVPRDDGGEDGEAADGADAPAADNPALEVARVHHAPLVAGTLRRRLNEVRAGVRLSTPVRAAAGARGLRVPPELQPGRPRTPPRARAAAGEEAAAPEPLSPTNFEQAFGAGGGADRMIAEPGVMLRRSEWFMRQSTPVVRW
jgi:hypothetical protein